MYNSYDPPITTIYQPLPRRLEWTTAIDGLRVDESLYYEALGMKPVRLFPGHLPRSQLGWDKRTLKAWNSLRS